MIALTVDLIAVTFWICAPVIVLLALGMVLARKTVHAALCLAGVMVVLGVLYAGLSAPFLFVAQLIVYTGSVMMLFLFTMMLIGVDTAEQMGETIRGQRGAAIVAAVALAALLGVTVAHGIVGPAAGLDTANDAAGGNAQAVATILFARYAVAFEAASALVIVAALAAMVLSHADKPTPKERQRERVARRLREYATDGIPLAPQPAPGVYARHNAATYPALLPGGESAPGSVAAALEDRGQAVVGGPSLKMPADALYNRLADQIEGLDGVPELKASWLADAAPALGTGAADDQPTVEIPITTAANAENLAGEIADPPSPAAGAARPKRGEA